MPLRSYVITEWHKRRRTMRVHREEILALHAAGLGCVEIGRHLGVGAKSVWRFLHRKGVPMRAANGSHRRVDVCACGKPAMQRGALCVECRKAESTRSSRESYRREHGVTPERRRV